MSWSQYLNSQRLRQSNRDIANDPRNEFESDFGRLVFSPAIRRMHDKTQVFPLTLDDNIHSRLTHSIEVMSIGHSLGLRLSENKSFISSTGRDEFHLIREIPVLLKNACLVHDIGNPPFGHFGETVIKEFFKAFFKRKKNLNLTKLEREDFEHFDGNAQGFRVLTKLQVLDDPFGLNLTYATLASYIKYPNTGPLIDSSLHLSKRGIFQSEKSYFNTVAAGCNLKKGKNFIRHPLAFLMEAADSICYLVMDIEDGFNKGWYGYTFIKERLLQIPGMKEKFKDLETKYNGFGAEAARVVNLRIYLISRLVTLSINNFLADLKKITNGTYKQELIYNDPDRLALTLKEFCFNYIFPNREIQSLELTGHSVLTGLLEYYTTFVFNKNKAYRKRAQGLISESTLRAALIENNLSESAGLDDLNDYFKLRVIVDFISGMTDQFALNHYQKLSGQKII